jgi:hypothetical protein
MSTRPERPVQGPSAPPKTRASTAESPNSAPPCESFCPKNARSVLRDCVGALSLLQVTVRSLEAQDIACAEQDVLTRAIQGLWSLHDWLHDRMWLENEAERAREREGQP